MMEAEILLERCSMGKCILIDGNSIANRAFYALPLLNNANGIHTNAVYGFTTMLMRLLEEEKPTHILVAFDAGKTVFRHSGYKEYKGGRAKTPPELSEQFPILKQLIEAFSIRRFELAGYEADDIIGTLTRLADEEEMETIVVTGDKDMLQLASSHVRIALTRKGISEIEVYNPEQIQEKYGLTPNQIIDLKGLMGDASDNIPGIPGVGEKTALKLLHEYGSVENVLEKVDELKGKMKEKVSENAEQARMSKELATILRDVPIDFKLDETKYEGYDPDQLVPMFKQLEFKSLLDRVGPTTAIDQAEMKPVEVTIVDGEAGIQELEQSLSQLDTLVVELIGENPHDAEVVGLLVYGGEKSFFLTLEMGLEIASFKKWLEDESIPKLLHDGKKAEVALRWKGIHLRGVTFDVLLASYVLNPSEGDHQLSDITARKSLSPLAEDDEMYGKGAKRKIAEGQALAEHLARKATVIREAVPVLREELKETQMESLYFELELPLSKVLADMEVDGIRVDADGLKKLGEKFQERINELVSNIYELAGTEFNINSPKQLGEILFDKLGLPVIKKTKTGYSTDAEVLEKLEPQHEIVRNLLHYRQLSKLQSTYIEGLSKVIHPKESKIHTSYNQTIAATGRLSSIEPNLQNIPIRLEEGRRIRQVFIPSKKGWKMLAADYSQIELRVLAHIAKDDNLIEAFTNDMDIHTKTAMDVFGVEESQVDSNMRRAAKAVNFGIVYGISDYGLSQNLHITRKEAAQFIEQYFAVFQGVKNYMESIVKEAKKLGYVSTLLQRRRYLPEINSSNFNMRSFAERTAMNSPIQGTAADIIKIAMIQMAKRIHEKGLQSRMLLQVHDELVFEVPEEELEEMQALVPEVMESAIPLDVPLKVDVSFGETWYDAK
jgi:DNA polymerase-1